MKPPTVKQFVAWIESAQHALDTGQQLTVDQCRALAATPTRPGAIEQRITWHLEEHTRLAITQARDKMPLTGPDAELFRWRDRQERRRIDMETLAERHAEALACAAGYTRPTATKSRARQGISAAEMSRRAVQQLDGQDTAA